MNSKFFQAFLNWDSQQGRDLVTSGRNKKNQLGHYIMMKIWYHEIWIQNYLGFIVSDLTYMYVFKSTSYSITLCPLCRVYNQIPLCNLSLALILSVSPRLILRKRQKQKTKKIHKMPKVQISPENKIYDGDGYLLRVACVCVRDNSENEVCFPWFILKQ